MSTPTGSATGGVPGVDVGGERVDAALAPTPPVPETEGGAERGVELAGHAGRCAALAAEGRDADLVEAARAYAAAARQAGEDAREAGALSLLAGAAQRCGQFGVAVEAQQREVELRARAGDRAGQAECLNNLGMLWATLGAHAEALAALYQCQQLCEQYLEIPGELRGTCGVNIGHTFLTMGQAAQARTFLEPGLETARRCGDLETELGALGMLGLVHKDLGDHDRATETLLHAIALAGRHNLTRHLTDLHDNLGQVHLERGETGQSETMFRQSLFWAAEAGDVQGEQGALLSLGRLAFRQGRVEGEDGALAHLRRALDLATSHSLSAARLSILEALFLGLEGLGREAEAYGYLRAFRDLERGLRSEESERQTRLLTARFEAEQARREAEMYRRLGDVSQHARLQAEETVRLRTAELEAVQIEIVTRLGMAAEYRDDRTGQHTRRVGELSAHLAQALGLPPEEVDLIRWAARLHDIGKIGVGDDVLLKTGRYTPEEFERMKLHTVLGAKVLEGSTSRLLRMAEEIARTHHERWDGGGYPRGLRGTDIPISGRIVAVADVFDALTSERPYKEAWSTEDALAEIGRQAGVQFDAEVVDRLLTLVTGNPASLAPLLAPRTLPRDPAPAMHQAPSTLGAFQPGPEQSPGDLEEGVALLEQAWALRQSDPRAGAELAARGLTLTRAAADDRTLGLAHRTAGYYRFHEGAYEEALTHLSQGLDLGILTDDQTLQADCANFIAAVYSSLHDYEKATDHIAVVLRIARANRDQLREAHCLHNLATLNYQNRDLTKARQLVEESLALYEVVGNVGARATALYTQANIAFDLNDIHLVSTSSEAAVKCADQVGNTGVKNIAQAMMGKAAARLGNLEVGKTLLLQAIEHAREIKLSIYEAWHHYELGNIHYKSNDPASARQAYESALAQAQELSLRDLQLKTYLGLSELCALEGRHQEAFDLYRKHHDVEREIFDEKAALKARALTTQLDVERAKSEAQIYRLRTIELASANEALERVNTEKSGLVNMLEEQSRLLEKQLSEDGLTGLFNRRHIEGLLQQEFLRSRMGHQRLCVAMADVDHFKGINDQFSHMVGDQVLRKVAQLFREAVRPTDSVGRFGGEEFLFVFPNSDARQGQAICERVRELVTSFDWSQIHPRLQVTLSIGVCADPHALNHEKLVSLADEELYRAKHSGRNRVCARPD
ncbi:diguanylate cyclase [Deinococcus sp. YIM 134068]|uniref:diguanylate cyclase n=1 Tax=Deinococcus lichenicola TaxID=3118910 RepID=UPI002F95874C